MNSKLFSLNLNDAQKAVIIAAISTGAGVLYEFISVWVGFGRLPTTVECLGALKVAAFATGSYLFKNFFSNSRDKFGKGESK